MVMGGYAKLTNFTLKEFYEIKTGNRLKCETERRIDSQVVVITGANTGIGKETALELSRRGAKVIMGCRDMEKAMSAIKEIKEQNPEAVLSLFKLDLSSLKSVRQFAQKVIEQENRIDILINNAGVMFCPEWKTADGFEMQFGTNHLGHFLLLPLLKRAPHARVITVASSGHLIGKINFNNINLTNGAYGRIKAYSQSKLANVLFMRELARRLGQDSTVHTYSLHPGVVNTELQRHVNDMSLMKRIGSMSNALGLTPVQGAQTTLYCALDESLADETGQYYVNCKKVTNMVSTATDDDAARKLWDFSNDLVNLEDHLRI